MKIRQLMDILAKMNPEADVFVAFFNADGTGDTFDIEDVTDGAGGGGVAVTSLRRIFIAALLHQTR